MLEEEILNSEEHQTLDVTEDKGLTLHTFTQWLFEINDQPRWRDQADKEKDYENGNQLNSDILQKMNKLNIPPAINPRIGPAVESVKGYEAKRRTDWRVVQDTEDGRDDVAVAANYKLNKAEKRAKADKACSDAFGNQIAIGVGIVEVCREDDPFKFPYKCQEVNRNEIYWDWLGAKEGNMDNARYLVRSRWYHRDVAKVYFPESEELLNYVTSGWDGFDAYLLDGGKSTGLYSAPDVERGWSIEEQEWRDIQHKRVRIYEVWYRVWEREAVIKTADGRIVEVDMDNPMHRLSLAMGIKPQMAVISKVRRAYFAGPHKLLDEPSPYKHNKFPYVFFWGYREDRTGVPFGIIRGMMYQQDNINASESKIRWGLSSIRTTRTKGAYLGTDQQLRQTLSRPDADVVLDEKHMAKPGATFKVERDFQLNEQQYKMLVDSRESIDRIGSMSGEVSSQAANVRSAAQHNSISEQASLPLAPLLNNFQDSRAQVGEMLLSMIIQDSTEMETINIPATLTKPTRTITLNKPVEEDGMTYLDNDVQRTMLKVELEEVPNTPSFRAQQLLVMGEAYKSSPEEHQKAMTPFLFSLMDVPYKDELMATLRDAQNQISPEVQLIQAQIEKIKAEIELANAQAKKAEAEAVNKKVDTQFSAMQTGAQVASNPPVVPIGDKVLENAGFVAADLPGNVNYIPGGPTDINTHPQYPGNPTQPQPQPAVQTQQIEPQPTDNGMIGSQTPTTEDNLP